MLRYYDVIPSDEEIMGKETMGEGKRRKGKRRNMIERLQGVQ